MQCHMLGLTFRILQVPVIMVFTKFDQFKREVKFKLEDQRRDPALLELDDEMERIFYEHYLANLRGSPPFVRLKCEYFVNPLGCIALISVLQVCIGLADGVLNFLK